MKQENPMGDLFPAIAKIMDYVVIKNQREADKHDTPEMARAASIFYQAMIQQDTYLLYTNLYTPQMFIEIDPTVKLEFVDYWINNPHNIPLEYRENLLERCREIILGPEYAKMRSDPDNVRDYHTAILTYYRRHVETNDYYRMLSGMPPMNQDESKYIYVPEEVRLELRPSSPIPDEPVHWWEVNDQNILMTTKWYKDLIVNGPPGWKEENPRDDIHFADHDEFAYLKYMGNKVVDPMVARRARDFQLIRYIPMEDSVAMNPYLLKDFANLYDEYRDYVMLTIYNRDLEDTFVGYRPFIAMLITTSVLLQLCNRAVEHSTDFRFIDDRIIMTIFQMYGIPKDMNIFLTKPIQRNLAVALMKMLRDKATNKVFYDIVKTLEFKDVSISKLLIMREQYYDEDGQAYFVDGSEMNTFDDIEKLYQFDEDGGRLKELALSEQLSENDWEKQRTPTYGYELTADPMTMHPEGGEVELEINRLQNGYEEEDETPLLGLPYFQAIDLKDENPYLTVINEGSATYDYFTITEPDPRWWDLQDTRDLIRNKSYSNADSKYIMLDAIIKDTDYLYEVVYFMRMILDNKKKTEEFMMRVPELFGAELVSMFDLMVFLLAAMCYNNKLDGVILTSASGLLTIAGFNFDIDLTKFREFLEDTEYVNRERVMEYMNNTTVTTPDSLNFIFSEIMIPFKDWLTYMMANCTSKQEYVEYEKVFRATYSYDIGNQIFVRDFQPSLINASRELGIADEDLEKFKLFYPHYHDGSTITLEHFEGSDYDPFIGEGIGLTKTWYVETGRGTLYFHDILNSPDLRYVVVDGERVPNPIFWDPEANAYDMQAINKVVAELGALPLDYLATAYFRTATLQADGTFLPGISYDKDGNILTIEYLPDKIRSEGIAAKLLAQKVMYDFRGYANPPETYLEYLERRSPILYDLFENAARPGEFNSDKWLKQLMMVVMAIEAEINLYLRNFQLAVVGVEMFFYPLLTMMTYFKSYMVEFTRTGIRYIFDSKIDPGGGSNMLKLFGEVHAVYWYILMCDEFGLYDTEHINRHHWLIKDHEMTVRDKVKPGTEVSDDAELEDGESHRRTVEQRRSDHGSIRLVDEVKFFLNGNEIDPNGKGSTSFWVSGEEGVGRFDDQPDHVHRVYDGTEKVELEPADTEAWKELQEDPPPEPVIPEPEFEDDPEENDPEEDDSSTDESVDEDFWKS